MVGAEDLSVQRFNPVKDVCVNLKAVKALRSNILPSFNDPRLKFIDKFPSTQPHLQCLIFPFRFILYPCKVKAHQLPQIRHSVFCT